MSGPAHIQVFASTISTNLISNSDLHPQCTNDGATFTCIDIKDLTANQVVNFWFKFAFQESQSIVANVRFRNAGGAILAEYAMTSQSPVTQTTDINTQIHQESQQYIQTWDTTSMNNDCGPKLKSNVTGEIKFKTRVGLFDYTENMEVIYSFTASDQLGWTGISTTATTNIISPTSAGADCFAQLAYSNP